MILTRTPFDNFRNSGKRSLGEETFQREVMMGSLDGRLVLSTVSLKQFKNADRSENMYKLRICFNKLIYKKKNFLNGF